LFLFKGNVMKTFFATPENINREWILIDADGAILGRLASFIAMRLRGKHKPSFTPSQDMGNGIIVINAGRVQLTGKKLTNKIYHWHTGYPGGIKSRTMSHILDGKQPERLVIRAVWRMLPGGPLSRRQIKNLRVYAGGKHLHEAQLPELIDFKSMNRKNTRSQTT
jgi:large subunit ribosomal protein L13